MDRGRGGHPGPTGAVMGVEVPRPRGAPEVAVLPSLRLGDLEPVIEGLSDLLARSLECGRPQRARSSWGPASRWSGGSRPGSWSRPAAPPPSARASPGSVRRGAADRGVVPETASSAGDPLQRLLPRCVVGRGWGRARRHRPVRRPRPGPDLRPRGGSRSGSGGGRPGRGGRPASGRGCRFPPPEGAGRSHPHPDLALLRLGCEDHPCVRLDDALPGSGPSPDALCALAERRPDALHPDLASSRDKLSSHLAELGRRKRALQAVREAVDLYRALAARWPNAFRPSLLTALDVLSQHLSDLGRGQEARTVREEAQRLPSRDRARDRLPGIHGTADRARPDPGSGLRP